MRYKILKDLKGISERREAIKLGELLRRLNQEKDEDNSLEVKRIFGTRYSVVIKDSHADRYEGTKVDIVIIGTHRKTTLDDDSDFYIVACFCRNSSRYDFSHWHTEDDNGITYSAIDDYNRLGPQRYKELFEEER